MNLPTISKDADCIYLTQDLQGMGTYDKSKAIVNFCDKETKSFEKEIDKVILSIFERNGINIPNTDKSVLKKAFATLNANGKNIEIKDLYKNRQLYNTVVIKETKNHFVVVLEEDRYLQCGIQVKEIRLWDTLEPKMEE